ncbi:MAG: NACHT domain-containing protein, partial [Rhodoferax sp.]|nr:NACHT domain-containing protein [Rhodoferax sp.]
MVSEALRNWNPEVVLAIGCAFGIDAEKQSIGEVIVSRQLLPYEPAAIRNGQYQHRGDRVTASAWWLNRLKTMDEQNKRLKAKDWPRLHQGVVLSGEKLVDDSYFKQVLTSLSTQIVGGEMEGGGLYTAIHAANPKPEWLLIKGISDWGEGKHANTPEEKEQEDKNQRQASTAAARVARALLTLESEKPEISEVEEDKNSTFRYRDLEINEHRLIALRGQATRLSKHHSSLRNDEDTRPTHGSDESTVDAMDYILHWLNAENAPPLFALLGEYGMGKTLLCMRVAREVPLQTTQTIKRQVLYFDLRDVLNIADQLPTLDDIISECSRRGYAHNDHPPTPKSVRQWYQQGALVIFDGLDEVLVHLDAAHGQSFTRGL